MSKGFHTVDLHACASASIPTPAIGQNGNWYVGNDDTGVSANGTPGPKGDKGDTGDKGQDVDVSRIERLEEDVSKLNSDLKWKLIGQANTVSIVGDYTEIYIKLVNSVQNWTYDFYIPVISLPDVATDYVSGHYHASHTSLARITVSRVQIVNNGTYTAGTQNASVMTVYGK